MIFSNDPKIFLSLDQLNLPWTKKKPNQIATQFYQRQNDTSGFARLSQPRKEEKEGNGP